MNIEKSFPTVIGRIVSVLYWGISFVNFLVISLRPSDISPSGFKLGTLFLVMPLSAYLFCFKYGKGFEKLHSKMAVFPMNILFSKYPGIFSQFIGWAVLVLVTMLTYFSDLIA
jgi:hypothetical protein